MTTAPMLTAPPPTAARPTTTADRHRLWTLAGSWFAPHEGTDNWCVQVRAATYEHARAITADYLAGFTDNLPTYAGDPDAVFADIADIVTAFYVDDAGQLCFGQASELVTPLRISARD